MKNRLLIKTVALLMVFFTFTAATADDELTMTAFDGREMTAEELDQVNMALSIYEDGEEVRRDWMPFMTNRYKYASELYLDKLLKEYMFRNGLVTIENKREPGGVEGYYLTSYTEFDNWLYKYTGLHTEDMKKYSCPCLIDKEKDTISVYINYTDKNNYGNSTRKIIYGKTDGETLMLMNLYGTNYKGDDRYNQIALKKDGDRYIFYSNIKDPYNQWLTNTYKKSGWMTEITYRYAPLPYDSTKGTAWNNAVKIYNQFINSAGSATTTEISYSYYYLVDVNHDGVPELYNTHNMSTSYLYGIIDGEVCELDCYFGNGQHGFTGLMENGYVATNHYSTQDEWWFYSFNRDLSTNEINFGRYWSSISDNSWGGIFGQYKGLFDWENGEAMKYDYYHYGYYDAYDQISITKYLFNGEVVSPKEYYQLTQPYLEMVDKYGYLNTKRYYTQEVARGKYRYFVWADNPEDYAKYNT